MKLFIGTPIYGASLHIETARSLLQEQAAAQALGVELSMSLLPGQSMITHARNQLAQDFMESDCETLVYIDADVSWEMGSALALANMPQEMVFGAYRHKRDAESYPVSWIEGVEPLPNGELIEVNGGGFGFMAVKRSVFMRMRAEIPRPYEHMGRQFNAWFTSPYHDGALMGEDGAFCYDWRSIGGKIWLAPEIALGHHDQMTSYPGHVGNWLRKRAEALAAGRKPATLDKIKAARAIIDGGSRKQALFSASAGVH